MKRKDSQVKELQSRLDSGEGCKLCLFQNVSVLGSGRFQAPMQVHSFCFFSVQSDFFTAGSGHEKYLISNLRCFLTHRILPVPNILCIFSEFMLIFIEVSWIICLKLTCVPVWLSGLEQGYYHSQTLIVKSHRSLFFLCQFKRERQREREREREADESWSFDFHIVLLRFKPDLGRNLSSEISLVKSIFWWLFILLAAANSPFLRSGNHGDSFHITLRIICFLICFFLHFHSFWMYMLYIVYSALRLIISCPLLYKRCRLLSCR